MNNNKKINNAIILPLQEYKFYDNYDIPDFMKEYFKKPIGLYDPYGLNVNPFTGLPYKNVYIDTKPITYDSGLLQGKTLPKSYKNWAVIWTNLPLYKMLGTIVDSIRNNSITLIKSGTGTGKSFLAGRLISQAFNFQKKILMTLPKKLLARDTALTTSITCDVVLGEHVGYFFKGDYNIDKNGVTSKIIFTTVGSMIRKITGDDPTLSEYSCIIIDETHERTVQTDMLILFLKKALLLRNDLKIVFISATLDIDEFKKYYNGYSFNIIDMGSDTKFEIKDIYEKKDPKDWMKRCVEIIITILKSKSEGDILVFVKSGADGNKIKSYLEPLIKNLNEYPFMGILEGTTPKDEQDYLIKEFDYKNHPSANPNKPYSRKIVFATNVAESSLTVKGLTFVIDSGLALEDYYDPLRNCNALLEKYVSKSAIKQRRGRVGRTKPGTCYHLYSEATMNKFIEYPIPNISKTNLTMEILDIMRLNYIKNFNDVKKLLTEMMTPPQEKFINSASLNLYSMEALSSKSNNGNVTELGKSISKFSGLPIYFARSIIASYYYHCKYDVIPIVVIVESLKGRMENLYLDYRPKSKLSNSEYKKEVEKYKKKQHRFDSKYGDFLTIHNIYIEFKNYMKLPKEFGSDDTMVGGDLDSDDDSNNENINTISTTESLTKKTFKDGMKWCIENGFRPNIFVNSKDKKNWDKVRNDAYKIDKTLMEIVQPAKLIYKNYKDYINDGGLMNKSDLKKEIKNELKNSNTIDPENKIKIKDINSASYELEGSVNGGYIQYGGFQKKSYEVNFFPNANLSSNKEINILMSFANGMYINIAKNIKYKTYKACYPLEKSLCYPDPKTTLPMSVKPSLLLYNELFMLKEDQKELKLNFINKLPTVVATTVKKQYSKYIEDCYKKEPKTSLVVKKSEKHYKKYKRPYKIVKKFYKK
jgi:pre-mRNA-splicing factor ATP-dependent RNA helicase DHX15/PRP43